MQEGFGSKNASSNCSWSPALYRCSPCCRSTLWTHTGVCTHALTRACPLFFLNLSTAEQLKQMALQQVAPQSAAYQ